MLFVTNRALKQSHRTRVGRKIDFDLDDNSALQSVFFCRRNEEGDYTEIGGKQMLAELRDADCKQVLVFLHGYSNLPENAIFQRAEELQSLFDKKEENLVEIVPFIWPCDNDKGIIKDYYDDQFAADASDTAFARVLERLREWQMDAADGPPCLKRINVLAHSMGNRVFRGTLVKWARDHLGTDPPTVFRNSFLMAADVVNETLEAGQDGEYMAMASRNTLVYFASDDLALRASKMANVKNKIASRRLGHTGPENMSKVARNVYAVDCEEVNTLYDGLKGHTYFLSDKQRKPGKVFEHLYECVKNGRVPPLSPDAEDRVTFLDAKKGTS